MARNAPALLPAACFLLLASSSSCRLPIAERHFLRNFVHDLSSHSHAITLAADDMAVLAIGAGAEAPGADPVPLDAVPVRVAVRGGLPFDDSELREPRTFARGHCSKSPRLCI
jgi:hypothetical protein